jgi:hypothetical protein
VAPTQLAYKTSRWHPQSPYRQPKAVWSTKLRLDDFHPDHLKLAEMVAAGSDAKVVSRDGQPRVVGMGEQEDG